MARRLIVDAVKAKVGLKDIRFAIEHSSTREEAAEALQRLTDESSETRERRRKPVRLAEAVVAPRATNGRPLLMDSLDHAKLLRDRTTEGHEIPIGVLREDVMLLARRKSADFAQRSPANATC